MAYILPETWHILTNHSLEKTYENLDKMSTKVLIYDLYGTSKNLRNILRFLWFVLK